MRLSLGVTLALAACTSSIPHNARPATPVHLERLVTMLSSEPGATADALKGAVPIRDGASVTWPLLAIARAILHTNPRIGQAQALLLADATVQSATANGLPPEFFAATMLQESAYDAGAVSSAGAVGIAQFMPETAGAIGVDPWDPFAALAAAGALLGGYAYAYRSRYADAYAAALAAYNAGPLAVAHYNGVPPYAETRDYIALIYDRWARIVSYEAMP
ncbi:MAG: transglycosylase SLT domain-containing protein [Candidatus Eremiobacteraeota bacterium]|nr:transglycosylase SLT domain-containing protein [Candidatus Eremiobacteraeota bacterium]MBV9055462.1 transglycosylase SLT domain-containing protein [Candidatus Eremiobacteraeota bacterium]MBV9699812.1 transglycosylase SLT domain-containing protein [Candidatus Eremiobacteraeota bacterium]